MRKYNHPIMLIINKLYALIYGVHSWNCNILLGIWKKKQTLTTFCSTISIPVLSYIFKRWMLTKEEVRRMETAKTHFIRAVIGYRIMGHNRHDYSNKKYENKWLEHAENMSGNWIRRLLYQCKLRSMMMMMMMAFLIEYVY